MLKGPNLSRRSVLIAGAGAVVAPMASGQLTARSAMAAAPMMGPSRPTHCRFELGSFECTTLFDGAIQLDGPHPIFGADQTPEAVETFAEENHLPAKRMEIGFTPLVVNTGSELVLFDTGNGAGRRPDAGNLATALRSAGFEPSQIDVVVITHMHPDHIGGLMEDGAPLFANARYVTGSTEYDFWSPEERLSGPTERAATLVQSNVVPLAEKTTFIGDDGEIVSGIRSIAAFGHTPGHMAYHMESDGRRLLLWADAANHYVLSVQKPDWEVSFDMDKAAAAATRRRLFDMAAAEKIPVTGYHMPFPAVGFVDRSGTGYRWTPVSYQLFL